MDSVSRIDDQQGLLLEPSNELRFKGPFDDFVTVTLTIRNPTDKRIAFKIKTTAPKRYCVKPNSGVLDPSNSTKVNVLLQPFTYDPNDKTKHKFMVQYVYLTDKENEMNSADILNMWKDVPNDRLLDIKLKCIFDFNDNTNNEPQLKSTPTNSSSNNNNNNSVQQVPQYSAQNQSTTASTDDSKQTVTSTVRSRNTDSNSSSVKTPSTVRQKQNESVSDNSVTASESVYSAPAANTDVAELKNAKTENQRLKEEIERLRENENRLKKLALQDSSKTNKPNSKQLLDQSLGELLNNKFVWIIILLLAIIIYLLLKTLFQ